MILILERNPKNVIRDRFAKEIRARLPQNRIPCVCLFGVTKKTQWKVEKNSINRIPLAARWYTPNITASVEDMAKVMLANAPPAVGKARPDPPNASKLPQNANAFPPISKANAFPPNPAVIAKTGPVDVLNAAETVTKAVWGMSAQTLSSLSSVSLASVWGASPSPDIAAVPAIASAEKKASGVPIADASTNAHSIDQARLLPAEETSHNVTQNSSKSHIGCNERPSEPSFLNYRSVPTPTNQVSSTGDGYQLPTADASDINAPAVEYADGDSCVKNHIASPHIASETIWGTPASKKAVPSLRNIMLHDAQQTKNDMQSSKVVVSDAGSSVDLSQRDLSSSTTAYSPKEPSDDEETSEDFTARQQEGTKSSPNDSVSGGTRKSSMVVSEEVDRSGPSPLTSNEASENAHPSADGESHLSFQPQEIKVGTGETHQHTNSTDKISLENASFPRQPPAKCDSSVPQSLVTGIDSRAGSGLTLNIGAVSLTISPFEHESDCATRDHSAAIWGQFNTTAGHWKTPVGNVTKPAALTEKNDVSCAISMSGANAILPSGKNHNNAVKAISGKTEWTRNLESNKKDSAKRGSSPVATGTKKESASKSNQKKEKSARGKNKPSDTKLNDLVDARLKAALQNITQSKKKKKANSGTELGTSQRPGQSPHCLGMPGAKKAEAEHGSKNVSTAAVGSRELVVEEWTSHLVPNGAAPGSSGPHAEEASDEKEEPGTHGTEKKSVV